MDSDSYLYSVQVDRESGSDHVTHVISAIKQHCRAQHAVGTDACDVVVLGNHTGGNEPVLTLSELFVHLWRRHRLHANERRTVVSAQDQMVVIQLCLAGINKETSGDFDVEASSVVEMQQTLLDDKMAAISCVGCDGSLYKSAEYDGLRAAYDQFLKYCNMVDMIDVFDMVKKELEHNSDLKKDISTQNYILINKPQASIEMEMLRVISANTKSTRTVTVATSLGEETAAGFVETQEATLEEAVTLCEDVPPSNFISVTEGYAEEVIVAYLQLLVNSRSELGLARALNVPDRELDHKAFTVLKKASREKGLSMFQTASSFIMKLRLGGRGYAPCSDNPLGNHVKGLSEFVDLLHKLQTIIEEDTNCSNAVKRVISKVKNTIIKHRDNILRPKSVEEAANNLQERAARVVMSLGSTNPFSPQRPAGMGGSMLGRDTLRVLRHLVDSHAGIPMVTRTVDVLSDIVSSQKTPLQFPCLLSKFRSPIETSPDDKINKSLAERLLAKMEAKPKVVGVPRYQASYDWAQPGHHVVSTKLASTFDHCIPSTTLMHAAASTTGKGSAPRRIMETLGDQENTLPTDTVQETVASCTTSAKRPAIEVIDKPIPSAKRQKPVPVLKKVAAPKKSAAAKPKTKKSTVPQKGQRQLTAFFRV